MNIKQWHVIPIIIITFIILIIITNLIVDNNIHSRNKKLWNNGICSDCGGTYIYEQAIGHQYNTYYIYKCKNCKNLIEINTYYKTSHE